MTFEEQFAHGVDLFNRKEFFDCHDEWEELWQEERSERRLFLQGMIQAAVGSYHLTNGNTTGAISQYTKSLDKLRQYAPDYFGINLEGLRTELERCLDGALTMQSQDAKYAVADEYFPIIENITN
jgi:predicted metal-dependent hydrolase